MSAPDEFALSGVREKLDRSKAEALVAPLREAVEQGRLESFKSITLSGKSFGIDAAVVFADALSKLKGVQHANLSDVIAGQPEDIALQVLEKLCSGVTHFQLKSLNLSDNALGLKGVKACAAAISSQQGLQELYFNNNGLQSDAVAHLRKLLLDSKQNLTLRSIHIQKNLLQNAGAVELAALITELPVLQSLKVAGTRVHQEGGMALCKALQHCPLIRDIDFSDNTFGASAGKELAASLRGKPHLVSVVLADSGIADAGVMAVAKVLAECPNVQHVDFSGNEVSAKISSDLGDALSALPTLTRVCLDNNDLDSQGAINVAERLAEHKSLAELTMTHNNIHTSAALQIAELIAVLPSLRLLNLNGNCIADAGVRRLASTLKENGHEGALGSLSENDDDDDEYEPEADSEDDEDVNKLAQKVKQDL